MGAERKTVRRRNEGLQNEQSIIVDLADAVPVYQWCPKRLGYSAFMSRIYDTTWTDGAPPIAAQRNPQGDGNNCSAVTAENSRLCGILDI